MKHPTTTCKNRSTNIQKVRNIQKEVDQEREKGKKKRKDEREREKEKERKGKGKRKKVGWRKEGRKREREGLTVL